jgi:uncharacterized 2Fe-2S/4Fe-4S cluster protein (DUF4445 family)
MALLSARSRVDVEAATELVEKVETAIEPAFQAHFVAAMGIPHSTLAYPHLAERVALPIAPISSADQGRRRTGRRTRASPPVPVEPGSVPG